MDVYPDDDSSVRESIKVTCIGVERCAFVLDFVELQDNRNAGNIANGYVKKFRKKKLLRVFLLDGYVDVVCDAIDLIRA
jgi:hypothetical protein